MAMGNSIEARQPYIDYRISEFSDRLPDTLKLHGLKEKWLLKQLGAKILPEIIWKRLKKPYRAPINQCFFSHPHDYVKELLSEKCINETGYYNTRAVLALIQKAANSTKLSEIDSMAVAGIISLQLVHQFFIKEFQAKAYTSLILLRLVEY